MAKSVTYSSTRGCETQKNLTFRDVVMTGLAHDRGLFVPDEFPTVTNEEIESWRSLSYADLAIKVISKFVQEDQVPLVELERIIKVSCAAFRSPDVTPLVEVNGHYVLVSEIYYRALFRYDITLGLNSLNCSLFVYELITHEINLKGTIPWTNLCIQRCCITNAGKFL